MPEYIGSRRRARRLHTALAPALAGVLMGLAAVSALAASQRAKEQILFVSDRDKPGAFAIYAMNPDGSGQSRVSKGEGVCFDPAWSPDHRHIVYCKLASAAQRTTSICVMNADGSDAVELLTGDAETINLTPAWSPDAKHIAYTTVHIGAAGADLTPAVYVMDADGSHVTQLTKGETTLAMGPAWAPDGKHILYTRLSEGANSSPKTAVWLMDADGGNAKAVTKDNSFIGTGTSMLFVMRAAGKK
jgi:Tol biopolymer transport system component